MKGSLFLGEIVMIDKYRRVGAQVCVAAAVRGHLARADGRLKRRRDEASVGFISRAWRRFMRYRHDAAVRLQAMVRAIQARRKYAELLFVISCATLLQSVVRFLEKNWLYLVNPDCTSSAFWQESPLVRSTILPAIDGVEQGLRSAYLSSRGVHVCRRQLLVIVTSEGS